ncbi:MAG: leucine-rich repeat domain-containing protein [Clostridia bacterium]|nr:leucine-rich repeat domain-containing protein [Clostridia bacterium]
MRRVFLIAAIVSVLLLSVGCRETQTYRPSFTLGEGFSLTGETITGTVVGEEYYLLFDVLDTAERFVIFGDSAAETFLESGVIPLTRGENRFVIRFIRDGLEREYELLIRYIPIRSMRVETVTPDRTYHIGERFDRSTVRVFAVTDTGEELETDRYATEYEFSELGTHDVWITLGKFSASVEVTVDAPYLPTLDGDFSADGVRYALEDGFASLIYAEDAEGFFAVPHAVRWEGALYPVRKIGDGAFSCSAVTGVLIADGVTTVASGAFSECEALAWVTLPDTLVSLGRQAFSGCVSLARAELPDGITHLPYGVFYGCESLFRVSMGDVETVGERAFYGCKALKQITMPRTLREIGASAFEGCEALGAVTLCDLHALGDRAFASCKALSAFALGRVETPLGKEVLSGSSPAVYTVEGSAVMAYARDAGLDVRTVGETDVYPVFLPQTVEIGEDYPYGSVIGFVMAADGLRNVSGYEIVYPADVCGTVDAAFVLGDYRYEFPLFVSYTETVLVDTDTRGVLYALDPSTKTAVLVSCPTYLKRSRVYTPTIEGRFLVPTALSCPDGLYTVTGVAEGAFDGCEMISEVVYPIEITG